MRRWVRILGTVMIVAGTLTLVWALVVWRWQDPFTALYTKYRQHQLTSQYERRVRAFHAPIARDSVAAERRSVAREARHYRLGSRRGEAIGRIKVPRMGVSMILVNGTDHETLKKGPGRDPRTFMPGQSRLVYVAGHRTTYLAPFSHIDRLRRGDRVTIEMPYATFVYRITGHRIVPGSDLAVLASHGREALELQACHPRFFATHRYIAYALAVQVIPRGGAPLAVRAGPGPATPYY